MNSENQTDRKLENLEGRSTPERRQALRKPKTRKVNKRLKSPPPFRPRERHYTMLEWLLNFRVMTQRHFEMLLGLHRGSVQPILRTLYDQGWVDRIPRPVVVGTGDNSPLIYKLGKHGITELQKRGHTDFNSVPGADLGRYWIDHALDLVTFSIAFGQGCERSGFMVETWLDERHLKTPGNYDRVLIGEEEAPTAVIADGYFKVRAPDGLVYRLWIEMDEGTESQSRIKRKVEAWLTYYKSGGMQSRFGGHGRVLFITPHPRRLRNLLTTAEDVPGIGRRFWFGLLSELSIENVLFSPVWRVAEDRQIPQPTPFASLFDR